MKKKKKKIELQKKKAEIESSIICIKENDVN